MQRFGEFDPVGFFEGATPYWRQDDGALVFGELPEFPVAGTRTRCHAVAIPAMGVGAGGEGNVRKVETALDVVEVGQ